MTNRPVLHMAKSHNADGELLNIIYTFYCPGCECHHFFNHSGVPPIWSWNGDMVKPTVTPSIKVTYGRRADMPPKVCHFMMTEGKLHYCSDCTHPLNAQVVDMVPDDD